MADKKTFIVSLSSDSSAAVTGSSRFLRISGEKLSITAEGYKITSEGEAIFAAPHHQIRYMQEEKSVCDNAASPPGAEQANLRTAIGQAVDEGLLKEKETTAPPRLTSLQEMAKEFYSSQPQIGTPTSMQIHAINSFIEFLHKRLHDTMLPRR